MKKTFTALLLILLSANVVLAQKSLKKLAQTEYFDFWIGEWDLSWKSSDGTLGRGTNTIELILDGKVIKENFEAISGELKGFVGKSYTVYNPKTETWHQTWVDNQGAYLDFVGKFKGDKRMFVRQTKDSSGNPVIQRMVFYDIDSISFTWDWEQSVDGGKTWQLLWKIAYRRH